MTTVPKTSAVSNSLAGDSGRALANAAETWLAATTESQREMIGFVSKRLEKDGETLREMQGCKNLADVAAIQSRWIQETLQDYSSEMTKLITIYTNYGNGGVRPGGIIDACPSGQSDG